MPVQWHPRPSREAKQLHQDAGEIVSPETAERFGYQKRIGKISNQGRPVYSAHFKAWLWEKQRGRCGYCGDRLVIGSSAHIDHVIPHSKGGSSLPPNLLYACSMCNTSKNNKGIPETRNILRVRQSRCAGIITPRQALALEAAGIDLGLPASVAFLCESEDWAHVSIPMEAEQ